VPLKKLAFKPGVSRENTRYTTEGGWYDCDKIRFRYGTPEKIGGWTRISTETFLGVCRSLWSWANLAGYVYTGVGTNLKFYIEDGGVYHDITPIRSSSTINNNPFALTASTTVTVTDTAHGCITGDFVTFSGAVDIGGVGTNVTAAVLNQEFQVTVIDANTYTITISVTPNATAIAGSPGGGAAVVAAYQINTGSETQVALTGWGVGGWGLGGWSGGSVTSQIRLWSQSNFGEDLIFGPRGGGVYYWDSSAGITVRGVDLATQTGASDVPTIQNYLLVSDISRFVFAFGCNDYGSASQDQMLIRWSDQEDALNWTPTATNQAGSLRLSRGSQIVTAIQSRQEILVWTDTSVYSLQFLGTPVGWGAQLVGENISIVSENAVAYANGLAFWMGVDKFYVYTGQTATLPCDLRQFVYSDINIDQFQQVCAGTNEGFNEIWWFYPSADSLVNDRYVVYNYLEKIWYYGTIGRTAWLDTGLLVYPMGATYSNNLVFHEFGVDDNTTSTPTAINAYIQSAETDLDDGDKFMFIRRVLPDLTFRGSTAESPSGTLTLYPLKNSGSGYSVPASIAGSDNAGITRTATIPIEAYTGQVYIRMRARQLAMKFESTGLGVQWQLGAMRLDAQPDGRASGSGVSGG
jgi:hypothetical protein